jgi:8-oxo-dGTP pyrophosphatase MutT (NUDIX family)
LNRIESLAAAIAARPPVEVDDPTRKLAAVAVVLVPDRGTVLLIRRADRDDDRWSGHMAFPGGRWSPGDATLRATAERETFEEVGVDLSDARWLGALDDIAPRTPTLPPLIVRPFVYLVPEESPLHPNHEVAAAAWVPLDELAAPGVYRPFELELAGSPIAFPGYHLSQGVVWGMTERILTPLLTLLGLRSDPTLPPTS